MYIYVSICIQEAAIFIPDVTRHICCTGIQISRTRDHQQAMPKNIVIFLHAIQCGANLFLIAAFLFSVLHAMLHHAHTLDSNTCKFAPTQTPRWRTMLLDACSHN